MNANALRGFVRTLLATGVMPVEIRNECHQLLLAVETEDVNLIKRHLARIQPFALETGVTIPEWEEPES